MLLEEVWYLFGPVCADRDLEKEKEAIGEVLISIYSVTSQKKEERKTNLNFSF